MLVPLGDEKPRDEGALRRDELLNESEERAFEERLDRHVGLFHLFADDVEMRGDDAAHYRLEQLFLGFEIEIGQALRHASARRHVLDLRRRVTLRRELLEGGGNDAYSLVKILHNHQYDGKINLLINQLNSRQEGKGILERMSKVIRKFMAVLERKLSVIYLLTITSATVRNRKLYWNFIQVPGLARLLMK